MIKLPLRVGDNLRERVEQSYAEAINQVGEAEAGYVREKLPRILADLGRGAQDWRAEVAAAAGAIFKVYEDPDRTVAVSSDTKAMLLAALFYLCNPYDVIPDRVPGTGFVDDAVVLNSCLQRLEKEDPELYQQIKVAMKKPRR